MKQALISITQKAVMEIKKAEDISQSLSGFVVSDQQNYDKAGEWIKRIKEHQDLLEEIRKASTRPLDEKKAKIMDLFRPVLEKLSQVAKILSRLRISYAEAQETKRRAEEARLAELQRKEAERLAKLAERAEEKGKTEKAEEWRVKSQETASILPTVAPTLSKTEGIKTITRWKAEVIDLAALVKAIAAAQASISFVEANLPQLNKQAVATHDTLRIAGVRFWAEKIESR